MKKWYVVKSYFRWSTSGRPTRIDKWFVKKAYLIEEKLILIRASSKPEARRKASKESSNYCEYTYLNIYGEKVKTEFLATLDCQEVESLTSGTEIFSSTEFVTRRPSSGSIKNRIVGAMPIRNERQLRRKFMHASLGIPPKLAKKYGIA